MEQEDIFSNEVVAPSTLPEFQRVDLIPVADAYLAWALITQTAFWLVLAAVVLVLPSLPFEFFEGMKEMGLWWLPLPPVGLAVIAAVHARLDARSRAWALREHDLIYRYGVVWRKTVIVPFARIQHVEAVHGPLERYLDLMRVKCFTAGGMSADLTVKGLDGDSARRVRQYLLEQIAQAAEDEAEPGDDRAGGTADHDSD